MQFFVGYRTSSSWRERRNGEPELPSCRIRLVDVKLSKSLSDCLAPAPPATEGAVPSNSTQNPSLSPATEVTEISPAASN